ncbi:MAG: peptide chain release factor N(5)-glutamine methyltransferase [Neisseriaceae bacterium]|nr:MAG: peptide chain release factor N(5)-glutamine methyltransferase [Neisseriaceae bacterium]
MQIKKLLVNSQLERLDNRLLLSYVTSFSHAQLIINDDYSLSNDQLTKYNLLMQRVLNGEPLAYILGTKEFYSRKFQVNSHTLIPRPETELLVDEVISKAKKNAKILDLGTGSGCIAITCKLERPGLNVTAVDNYAETLLVAKSNANSLNADVNFVQSNWFEEVNQTFDIIVSNPPYIEVNDEHLDKLQFEPKHALTDFSDGLSAIKQIIYESCKYLNNNGWLMFEHGYNQAENIRQMFYNCDFTNIETIQDYANLDRITLGQFIIKD